MQENRTKVHHIVLNLSGIKIWFLKGRCPLEVLAENLLSCPSLGCLNTLVYDPYLSF